MTSLHRIILFLLCLTGVLSFMPVSTTHAASFTAVQSGDWYDEATWGGSAYPEHGDDVTIPVGITVTISDYILHSGQITINGELVAEDSLTTLGSIQNNGTLSESNGFTSAGTFTNAGTFTTNVFFHNLGTLTNTASGVIINEFVFINGGESGITFNNAGSFTNNSDGIVINWAPISNTGSISNMGLIEIHCNSSITGNAVTGNAPVYVALPRPTLGIPAHRTHTTDRTPQFGWTANDNGIIADSFRLMIYREDRSFQFKKRVFTSYYTLEPTEWLANGKFLWRVRTQFEGCPIWSGWSGRNTLFIES